MPRDLVFNLEIDVVNDRSSRPWREHTRHARIAVADRPSLASAETEARNFAAWMCWGVRGDMVTAVRITSAEL